MQPRIRVAINLFACLVGFLPLGAGAAVVINEIMFHPPGLPGDNLVGEWLELLNTGTAAVDVGGWQFTKGITYAFHPNTMIPAKGYLVVAADLGTFTTTHPGFS